MAFLVRTSSVFEQLTEWLPTVWNVDGIKVVSKTRKEHLDEIEVWDKKEKDRKAAEDKAKAPESPQKKEVAKPTSPTNPDDVFGEEGQETVPGGFGDVDVNVPETEEDVERILNDVTSTYDSLKAFVGFRGEGSDVFEARRLPSLVPTGPVSRAAAIPDGNLRRVL